MWHILLLQLRVVPPNAARVWHAAVALEILFDVRSLLDRVVKLEHAVVFARLLQLAHGFGKCILGSIQALIPEVSIPIDQNIAQ